MRTRLLPAAAALLALAACDQGGGVASAPAPGGIPAGFHALGTEPFWSLDVKGIAVRYATPELPEAVASDVVRSSAAGVDTVSGKLGEVAFAATIGPGRCSDGMSDRVYPFAVKLRVGDRDLAGCAAAE